LDRVRVARGTKWLLLGVLSASAGCYAGEGEATGALCDRRIRYADDVAPLLQRYCLRCHAESVPLNQRHGAPGDENFDTELGVMLHAEGIALRAAGGFDAINRSMPPSSSAKQPSDQERKLLGSYLACVTEDAERDGGGHVHSH
jgi:uncharacterized membrane protein